MTSGSKRGGAPARPAAGPPAELLRMEPLLAVMDRKDHWPGARSAPERSRGPSSCSISSRSTRSTCATFR